MQVQGKTSAGVSKDLRTDADGRLVSYRTGGKLAEAALAGRLFSVCNQAAVAVSAALSTTWTGLGICNPTGSGKILVVHQFSWAQSVVNPAEGVVGLMRATETGFAAALTARCARLGYATSVALCDDGATISTPVLDRLCGSTMEGAISTAPSTGPHDIDLEGSIVLAPNQSLLTYHTVGGTASLLFGFVWEEQDE